MLVSWLGVQERNDLKHENQPRAEEKVLQNVVWESEKQNHGEGEI